MSAPEMTLVEAFELLQPISGLSDAAARRVSVAAKVIYDALIAEKRVRIRESHQLDMVQLALYKLTKSGPHRLRPGDEEHQVRRYLYKTLNSAKNSIVRREKKHWNHDDVSDATSHHQSEARADEGSDAAAAWNELVALVGDNVILKMNYRSDAIADAQAAFEELIGIATGQQTMESIVEAVLEPAADQSARIKARNRVYTRHKRCRERILATADALKELGELSAEHFERISRLVEHLRGPK